MSLFRPAGSNYMPATDVAATVSWYMEKFGLRKVKVELDDGEDCVALGFERDECAVVVGPRGKPGSTEELTAMLFTSNVKKAREYLASRGVQVSEIQQDGQGTRYVEVRDLEGNPLEITEEP
jgi:predicted enzyme related to lactoylglutathione lyase